MLSVNVNTVDWRQESPGKVNIYVPHQTSGLKNLVEGTLEISSRGYVYTRSSSTVVWLKFLGLSLHLSISGMATRCKHIAKMVFCQEIAKKELSELKHIFKLASIASSALSGKTSLNRKIEEFALAEISYNNSNIEKELHLPRSIRLTQGTYFAKCMQPLFHKDQGQKPSKLAEKIKELDLEKAHLEKKLNAKQSDSFFNFLPMLSPKVEREELLSRLAAVKSELDKKITQQEIALRCNKYAAIAVLTQQGWLSGSLKEAFIETRAHECCGVVWFKDQRICGLIHKIDCCALQCWAINCLGCFCCIWPSARVACLL